METSPILFLGLVKFSTLLALQIKKKNKLIINTISGNKHFACNIGSWVQIIVYCFGGFEKWMQGILSNTTLKF